MATYTSAEVGSYSISTTGGDTVGVGIVTGVYIIGEASLSSGGVLNTPVRRFPDKRLAEGEYETLTHSGVNYTYSPGITVDGYMGWNAQAIPTGPFDAVRVAITNQEGKLITGGVTWLLPGEKFPVAVRPRDGFATLRLLKGQKYDKFQLIIARRNMTDVVLYEQSGIEIASSDGEAILEFDTGDLASVEDWDGSEEETGEVPDVTNQDIIDRLDDISVGMNV